MRETAAITPAPFQPSVSLFRWAVKYDDDDDNYDKNCNNDDDANDKYDKCNDKYDKCNDDDNDKYDNDHHKHRWLTLLRSWFHPQSGQNLPMATLWY